MLKKLSRVRKVFSEGLEGTRLVPCSREREGARPPLRNLSTQIQKPYNQSTRQTPFAY